MKIHFVSQGGPHLASHRMRVLTPARLIQENAPEYRVSISPRAMDDADVNIFHKHFDIRHNLLAMDAASDKGYKTIFDVCDDHFDREYGDYYEAMVERADVLTCNSDNMQERLYQVSGKLARIVDDPITFPFYDPIGPDQIKKIQKPKVLWYGHFSNIMGLNSIVENLKDVYLTVITNQPYYHKNVDQFYTWDLGVVEEEIQNHHIVILPTIKSNPWIKAKSANRAVDALHAGRFVITDNNDIYGHLKEFVYITNNVQKGIDFFKENPYNVSDRIRAGQEHILQKHSSFNIYEQWMGALKDIP